MITKISQPLWTIELELREKIDKKGVGYHFKMIWLIHKFNSCHQLILQFDQNNHFNKLNLQNEFSFQVKVPRRISCQVFMNHIIFPNHVSF